MVVVRNLFSLMVALDEAICAIVATCTSVGDWSCYLVLILEELEQYSISSEYEVFLLSVRDSIAARLEDGRW